MNSSSSSFFLLSSFIYVSGLPHEFFFFPLSLSLSSSTLMYCIIKIKIRIGFDVSTSYEFSFVLLMMIIVCERITHTFMRYDNGVTLTGGMEKVKKTLNTTNTARASICGHGARGT